MSERYPPKAEWGEGPWTSEPDSAAWTLPGGYEARALRPPWTGNWCGYVGVPKGHPAWGFSYTGRPEPEQEERNEAFRRSMQIARPTPKGKDFMEEYPKALEEWHKVFESLAPPPEPEFEPIKSVEVHGGLTYSGPNCPGSEADGRWWFGFDCGHYGDISPAMDATLRSLGQAPVHEIYGGAEYRTLEYVTEEINRLGSQLKAMEKETADAPSQNPRRA